jgi:hypothetical protein
MEKKATVSSGGRKNLEIFMPCSIVITRHLYDGTAKGDEFHKLRLEP